MQGLRRTFHTRVRQRMRLLTAAKRQCLSNRLLTEAIAFIMKHLRSVADYLGVLRVICSRPLRQRAPRVPANV